MFALPPNTMKHFLKSALAISLAMLCIAAPAKSATVPILNSRPDAAATLYLDFDGETINEKEWTDNPITCASFNLPDADIAEIVGRVGDDFAPFNINVTTDEARYYAAPVGRRMRMIVTPTQLYPPAVLGGIAYDNSFSGAGVEISAYKDAQGNYTPVSQTVPAFCFLGEVNVASETISHELGHTLGLSHDGNSQNSRNQTYFGHGPEGAPGSWAPIMGAGFRRPVTHWSRGEYSVANNKEDDLAIIASARNGFGYAPDEAGDSAATSARLGFSDAAPGSPRSVRQSGVIVQASDRDWFSFATAGGPVSLSASSPGTTKPNLDILVELRNQAGEVLASSNPDPALSAAFEVNLSPGNYFVTIDGVGRGDGLTSGYTDYGSLGAYTLSGTLPAAPVATGSAPSGAIISEFRFEGPGGPRDEFVEIYNTLSKALNVSGWALQTQTESGPQFTTIPEGTMIPARGHFLFVGGEYSLKNYGLPDAILERDALSTSGAAILNASGQVQDAVGFNQSGAELREGAGLPSPSPSISMGQGSWMRDYNVSLPRDSGDSSRDFVLVSPLGQGLALGAASPEGLRSPLYSNNTMTTLLLDPNFDQSVPPNRVRTGGLNSGTILIRRTLVNKSGKTLSRVRLSVTRITSLGAPVFPGYTAANQADVRLVSSVDEMGVPVTGGAFDVYGTTVEAPTDLAPGGGLGSSVTIDSMLSVPLKHGQSRSYSFLLRVVKSGNFSVAFNIEGVFAP